MTDLYIYIYIYGVLKKVLLAKHKIFVDLVIE